MTTKQAGLVQTGPDRELIAMHVLRFLTSYQRSGHLCSLQHLVDELNMRRADIRSVVSALHREGYVDALRMRVTLAGLAATSAIEAIDLPPPRRGIAAAGRASCEAA